jgi:hypothetical protein
MSLRQKAKELGVPYSTYLYRIKQGWNSKDLGKRLPKAKAGHKVCSVCLQEKTYTHFYKRYGRNGYISRCKDCAKKTTPKGG